MLSSPQFRDNTMGNGIGRPKEVEWDPVSCRKALEVAERTRRRGHFLFQLQRTSWLPRRPRDRIGGVNPPPGGEGERPELLFSAAHRWPYRGGGAAAAAAAAAALRPGSVQTRSLDQMASGDITTLPAVPEDGGSGTFPPGNFKEPKRLYCKNGGYFLRIHPDGRVDGIRDKSDPHIKLQLQATSVGEVVIKGLSANRYLAMNADGRLFGMRRPTDECYFIERLEANNYNTYRSRKYPNWYVALKRTGQYKSGSKTGPGQKAILFLPMSAKC